MVILGYEEGRLKERLQLHLERFPWYFPDVRPGYQFTHIMQVYDRLKAKGAR
jgi:hypothetical protein